MGWFDEQIRTRKQNDEKVFSDAFIGLSSVVMGKKAAAFTRNERERAHDAIEEILKFYHIHAEPLPKGVDSVSDQLEFLLRPSGIMRREVSLKGDWYKDSMGPLLGFFQDGSPAALIPHGGGYRFFDWESARTVRLNKDTASRLKEEAFCFYKPLPLGRMTVRDLFGYIWGTLSAFDYMFLLCVTLAVTLLGLISPAITQLLYSYIVPSGQISLLLSLAVMLTETAVSAALVGIVRQLALSRMETKLSVSVEAAVMARVLSLPASFFKQFSAGDLSSRMQGIGQLCAAISSAVLGIGASSLFSLIYLGQVFSFAPSLVAPSLLITLLSLAVTALSALCQVRYGKKQLMAAAKNSGVVFSLFTGIQKIRLAGAERRAFAHWAEGYREQAEYQYASPVFVRAGEAIAAGITTVGTILIYYSAAMHQVAAADYIAFSASFGMVSGALTSLASVGVMAAQIRPLVEMVEPILQAEPEVAEGKQMIRRLSGGLELSNISFRYVPDGPLILDNVSLKIRPGQYVAVVGETGCGKSTLMRLMLGFEKPQKGAVYYDGKDLAKADLKSLRQHIGVVMQNGKLFQGDIYSNIVISAPELSLDDAWEAAEMAGIADDIRAMPMGMHTLISEGGGGISGGQRQRLMIARAIAPRPRILMLDEATSALDNVTQKKVSDSLERLGSTRIVIAHRLSTIRHCDRILVMEKGRITADGTYEELMRTNEYFAGLVRRQQIDG